MPEVSDNGVFKVRNEEFFAQVDVLLSQGKKVTIPCRGHSMLPSIRGGKDLVVLERRDRYVPGDIVLFSSEGRHILHRIVKIGGKGFIIRGDGNYRGEETCAFGDIRGKAVEILRGGSKPVDPYSPGQRRKLAVWNVLLPLRRYLIAIYVRFPWNRNWIRNN